MEHYDGDTLAESTAAPAGFVLHTCPISEQAFYIQTGTACPNRRLGCSFVAEPPASEDVAIVEGELVSGDESRETGLIPSTLAAWQAGGDEELLRLYLEEQDIQENSKRAYARRLRQFFGWLKAEGLELRFLDYAITRQDIIHYREALLDEASPHHVRVTTAMSYLVAVRGLFGWLADQPGGYGHNPAARVKTPKVSKKHKKDTLTPEQLQEVLAYLRTQAQPGDLAGLRNYAIFQLMARTGLRTVEVSRATVGNLRQEQGEPVLYVQGKGRDEADEYVLLMPKALQPIRQYLSARAGLFGRLEDEAPLFASHGPNNRNGQLTTIAISRIIKTALRAVGLDDKRLSAHSLRHTAITLAAIGGAAPRQTQSMARHASGATTDIYLHNLDRLQNAAERYITQF